MPSPADFVKVASTFIEAWEDALYPDFVAERSGDQATIMEAICAAKKASFDGVDCVREDAAATGTVWFRGPPEGSEDMIQHVVLTFVPYSSLPTSICSPASV